MLFGLVGRSDASSPTDPPAENLEIERSISSLRNLAEVSALHPVRVLHPSEILETVTNVSAFTEPRDRWTGFDKVQHMTFSLLSVLATQYVLVNKIEWSERGSAPTSAGLTAALGLAKEFYDWRFSRHRHFSGRDLIADAVGIAAGIIIVLY